jgi:Formamidopyrimidine-DNA glycosylase
MIELPESTALAKQFNEILVGKTVTQAIANTSPHKFAWFTGDPADYNDRLSGRKIVHSEAHGGMAEIHFDDGTRLIFCDGTNVRYFTKDAVLPKKHQLHLIFDDSSSLICSVQMYGALWVLDNGQIEGYNQIARDKVSPLSDKFDEPYFNSLYSEADGKLSTKAFIATKQRIPGLGNGVAQDILFNAKLHPKRKMNTLETEDYHNLFVSIKTTLTNMTKFGGRNTEKDIFANEGGYKTILSSKTKDNPCIMCGSMIIREAYLGGNIYYCPQCQK